MILRLFLIGWVNPEVNPEVKVVTKKCDGRTDQCHQVLEVAVCNLKTLLSQAYDALVKQKGKIQEGTVFYM